MGKHQIIYTSCKRGINGINDGQQVYSYDASFSDNASENVKSLFTYQVPTLAPGVSMTEEIAETMPQSFIYRRLPDNSCAFALNTYLGRDYMGSAGRFGNHLSHVVVCDENELNNYPCEFYGSELLRNRMDFDEVNSPNKPTYLSEPELLRGYRIDAETVIDFLNSENRMETYKKMLASMLAYESARKRVLICDTVGNIIIWIAALHYALPLEIALNINITTYEYDPSLSVSQICGVVPEGTRYSASNASSHFTFDFFQNIVPEIETEGEFFDFIDMGISMSYDSIQDFHEFVCNKLTYRNSDEQYYNAYYLYCLFTEGLNNLSISAFKSAVNMSNKFAYDSVRIELASKLISEKEFILRESNEYSIEIFKVILAQVNSMNNSSKDNVKSLITEKAIAVFVSGSVFEESFTRFYSELESLCNANRISIPFELMKDENRQKLISSMRQSSEQWKWSFIIDVICEYAAVQQIPADKLSMDYQIGQLICNIVLTRISSDANNGFKLITRVINKFANEWNYLSNMALNIESALFDLPESARIIDSFWKYIYQTIVEKQSANRQNIFRFFFAYDRFEQVFNIFNEFLSSTHNIRTARELFQEQLNIQNKQYLQKYIAVIIENYYEFLLSHKESDTISAKKELLKLIVQANMSPKFIRELIDDVLSSIPLSAPTKENEELMTTLLNYYKKTNNKDVSNRLLLIVSGALLGQIQSISDLHNAVRAINSIVDETINLANLSTSDAKKFIEWIGQPIFTYSQSSADLLSSYGLFRHTRGTSNDFIAICAKEGLKESKGDKEYGSVIIFLEFLFKTGNADNRKDVGKILCKLSKQKLEALDSAVQAEFRGEKELLFQWEEIREIAATTNPLLSNLGNLFKRKKD